MKFDVIIVGGGAGGLASALALKNLRPELKVIVLRRTRVQPIPCSIPYIVETLGLEGCLIPDALLANAGVELRTEEVVEIDRVRKVVKTAGGNEYEYDKLILATGTKPARLNIKGFDLDNVVPIYKEYEPLQKAYGVLRNSKKLVIIGAGFVGVEFADDLARGREVHVVEVLDEALPLSFDKEFGEVARRALEAKGVIFHLNTSVTEIRGEGRVKSVVLSNGEELEADAVLVSVGVEPNTEFAVNAGLAVDHYGHLVVDSFMRTSDPDIYAVGDIAQKKDFFTGRTVKAYFATLAVAEGRVAALHVAGLNPLRGVEGVLPVYSTVVSGTVLAAAGLTESLARKLGLNLIPVTVEAVNRHPSNLPGAARIKLKAVFTRGDLRLAGVQVAGPEAVGEMINYAAAAIQSNLTAYDILKLQLATQPLLTASPLVYPLQLAAFRAVASR
ncbi:MAG: FAD-dependent oxidoreductase [Thermofilaceae archaeon]|nr:FAD-dependent oxidoreductase [Thermofilaceae archaeon]MDW8003566.1 FAD-dependent oxidoreductase [Thermofilaceae archaeon]